MLKRIWAGIGVTVCLLYLGCGTVPVAEAGIPVISQVIPQTITAGASNTTLQVVGANITDQTVVLWNGAQLPTTIIDNTTVASPVQSASLAVPGTAELQLLNSITGKTSASVEFKISSAAALLVTTTSLPNAVVGAPYSATLTAAGGIPGYTWKLTSGKMPSGLSLSSSTGVISGTPTAAGTFSLGITVSDKSHPGHEELAVLTLSVSATTVNIITASLPGATDGTSYSQTLQASGGIPSYSWSITSGSLPTGLTLASSGVISGIPTASGTFSFNITAADKGSPQQTQTATLSITAVANPLKITTGALTGASLGAAYSQSLTASGGIPAYSWSLSSGSLPAGLALSSTGAISGTPTASGTFSFAATVSDKSTPAQTLAAALTLTVAANPLQITTAAVASGATGSGYSQSLIASGGIPAYSWSLSSGNLPAGLTLASTGVISGTPTASGTFSFAATVSDKSTPVQTRTASLTITVAAVPLKITTSALIGGTIGTAYSQTLDASGGTAGYSWSISSGSLPAGLTLTSTGAISGTPSTTGTSSFAATVSDSGNPIQTQSATLSIVVAATPIKIMASALAPADYGRSYSQSLQATGGTPTYKWSIASGQLPSGLSLSSTGAISGTPTSGTSTFTASVSDSGNPVESVSAPMTITVAPGALTITGSSLPAISTGSAYAQTLHATGGAAPYRWTITSGQLPVGLSLSSSTGMITGTPSVAGTANFIATVNDSSSPGQTASIPLTLVVTQAQSTQALPSPLSILAPGSSTGTIGSAYSLTLGVTGGTGPYSWSIASGQLPVGLSLSAPGVISGTPSTGASGIYSVTVSVADSESPPQTASASISISVPAAPTPLTITSSNLLAGTTGTAYSQALQATGGTPAYTWSIRSGSLPTGLSLAATTGTISGTPTTAGTSNFTATVTDNGSPAQVQSLTTSITTNPAQQGTTGPGTWWYVRQDGGTRYSTNVTNGQCDGKADAAYPGSGVNQHCAYNDVRYLWSDNSGAAMAWVIAGGDTAIIRGCTALSSQVNADNPHCRLGYDNPNNGWSPNQWCGGGVPNSNCYNPPIPAGTAGQHTRILGECAVTNSCNPSGVTNPKLYASNLTQLYGGFGLEYTLNLQNTQFVDIEGLEITTHNGKCSTLGSPLLGGGCSTSPPYSDFDVQGIVTNNTTANITLQDVYIHGFNSSGLLGPIGGPIAMTRMFIGFNAFAGWNFDDGHDTPDGAGSSLIFNHAIFEGNGCQEEYPIIHTFPAVVCYDDGSNGFGDAISGQDTNLDSLYANDYQAILNTKDGFIGPHTWVTTLTVINSAAIYNMGQQWKWGSGVAPNTTLFENNLTVSGCQRMSEPLTNFMGLTAPSTYNQYLGDFCRAAGNVIASTISAGSTWTVANNTIIFNTPTLLDISCPGNYPVCSGSTVNWFNNIVLGYGNIPTVYGLNTPAIFYNLVPNYIAIKTSNNIEYGTRNGACPSTGTHPICADPLFVNEPAQSVTAQSALDVFNLTLGTSSFYPASNSPMIDAGTSGGPSTDYFGVTQTFPPTIGAVVPGGN